MTKDYTALNKQYTVKHLNDMVKRIDINIEQVSVWFDVATLPNGLLAQQLLVREELLALIAMVERIGANDD